MVLKEVYDPNIFTYIMAIVDLALVHNVQRSKFNFCIGNPLIQVAIVSFMTIYM